MFLVVLWCSNIYICTFDWFSVQILICSLSKWVNCLIIKVKNTDGALYNWYSLDLLKVWRLSDHLEI